MDKKQHYFTKLFLLFFILFLSASLGVDAQDLSFKLTRADSLFMEKKYTESFELYEQILAEEEKATPQMLMKMAFIKEGLGDNSQALLYLNKYYLKTSDKKATEKMQSIAKANQLNGYDRSDADFFIGLLNEYYYEFIGSTLGIALLLFAIAVYKKIKKSTSFPYALGVLVILIPALWLINFELDLHQGIISENHAYLMSAPSSGSDLIDVVKKGHRVSILEETDTWIKVDWNGKEAYIKKGKLLTIG